MDHNELNRLETADEDPKELAQQNNTLQTEYNKLFDEIGKSGKYQKLLMMVFLISSFVGYFLITLVPMMKELPSYQCFNHEDFEEEIEYLQYKNNDRYQIIKDEQCINNYCSVKNTKSELPWILVADLKSQTNFISGFQKFCKVDEFFGTITQFHSIGRLCGMFTFSYLSDQYGRILAYKGQLILLLTSIVLLGMANNEFFFILSVIFNGAGSHIFVVTIVICSEVMDQKMFSIYNGIINAIFPLSGIFNVIVYCITRNWYYCLVVCFFALIFSVFLGNKLILESPSFLLSKKRYECLNNNIELISEINGTKITAIEGLRQMQLKFNLPLTPKSNTNDPDYRRKTIKGKQSSLKELIKFPLDGETKYSRKLKEILGPYYVIFSQRLTALRMCACCLIFFNLFFMYFGLLYNLDKIEGNIYFHSLIVYISEMVSELLSGYLLSRYKRINLIVYSNIPCIICSLILIYCEGFISELALFSFAFFVSIAFVVVVCYTAELFEPSIRSTATSIGLSLGVFSLIVMPYLLKIASPFKIFIVMIFINFIVLRYMKETKEDDTISSVTHH